MFRHKPAAVASLALAAAFAASPVVAQMPRSLPPEALADAPDATKAAWLREHVVAEGPVTGGMRFALPRAVFTSRLVLLGESHGSAATHVVDLELLTLLNARAGVRDYLIEADPLHTTAVKILYNSCALETVDMSSAKADTCFVDGQWLPPHMR